MPAMARPLVTTRAAGRTTTKRSAAVAILGATVALSVPFMILATVDAGGLRTLWDNLHWSISAVGATTAAGWAIRGTTGRIRRVRQFVAIALALWTIATLNWAWMMLWGTASVPSLTDLCIVAIVAPGLATIVATVRGHLSRAEETAVYLDATLGFLLIGSALVFAAGPTAVLASTAQALAALSYPTMFIGLAGAGLIAMLAVGYPVSRRGSLPLFGGSAIIGLAYVGWIAPAMNLADPGELSSLCFTLGTLAIGWGAVTWDDATSDSVRYRAVASVATRIVAPTAASLLFLLVLAPKDASVIGVIQLAIFAASIVFVVRQGLLLRERTAMLERVTTLTEENGRLVGELRIELARRARDERRMIQASRSAAVGDLAAGVAHEVNNPLTGVLGFAELLIDDMAADNPHRADVETIRDEALRARAIVRALRDFASPRPPSLAETDLSTVVRQTIDLARYSIERRGIRIDENLAALPEILIDARAVQQAVLNVLANASQAVRDNGRIEVTVAAAGDERVITIADDGVGMDAETARLAFEPFFSARPAEHGAEPATGLGLSVSAGLIESLSGTISIDSTPGRGTTVVIRLPAVDARSAVDDEGMGVVA